MLLPKIDEVRFQNVSENDQDMTQSQTADKPMEP